MESFLAIDIGASSGRHILGTVENGCLTMREIYRFKNGMKKQNGHLVWDVDALANEVIAGLAACETPPVSVAIDTWAVDYVLLGKEGKLDPVYAYRDSRTEDAVARVDFDALYRRTGIQKQPFNTVYQLLSDDRLRDAEHLLMIPDYLGYVLTGQRKQEYTNATTTSLVSAGTGEFDRDLIRSLGLPEKLFLPLSRPGTSVGHLTKEIQRRVGFDTEVVLCGSHDTASAVCACALQKNTAYLSSGTWSLLGTELAKPLVSPEAQNRNFTNEGGVGDRIRFLKNYMGMWLFQSLPPIDPDERMHLAEQCDAYRLFDVNDPSLLAPDDMKHAILSLIGDCGDVELYNSIYHSLAFSYAAALREIAEVTGEPIERLCIVGGGSRDTYLNRLTEEYAKIPVIAGVKEATAAGNLFCQWMKANGASLADARKLTIKEER